MKIKTLVAVLLLSGGVTSTFAQTENCNSNSSISHEAVRAGNFKDAYAPCMAVLKDCPTLRYYTFTDAQKILVGFLSQIKDRNSADYKKYFDELMDVYDLRMLMIIIPTSFSRIILMLPSMQMTHLLLKPRKLRRLTCKLSRITSWPCSFRVV